MRIWARWWFKLQSKHRWETTLNKMSRSLIYHYLSITGVHVTCKKLEWTIYKWCIQRYQRIAESMHINTPCSIVHHNIVWLDSFPTYLQFCFSMYLQITASSSLIITFPRQWTFGDVQLKSSKNWFTWLGGWQIIHPAMSWVYQRAWRWSGNGHVV
jgi:hypothetical protein